jgi:hypothetical protein
MQSASWPDSGKALRRNESPTHKESQQHPTLIVEALVSISAQSSTDSGAIPLQKLPALLQSRFGKRVSYGTCFRWVRKGVAGIKLQTIFFCGQHFVSTVGIDEFLAKVTQAKLGNERQQTTAEKIAYRKRQSSRAKVLGI